MKVSHYIFCIMMLLMSACAEHKETPGVGQLNTQASLPADFNFSKLGLKVITSTVNKKLGTMATLYGNDSAKATVTASTGKCSPGTIFALVTWKQQPDKRWIGGNIPGNLSSVEILKAMDGTKPGAASYKRFAGVDLKAEEDTTGQDERTKYILGLKPSPMF